MLVRHLITAVTENVQGAERAWSSLRHEESGRVWISLIAQSEHISTSIAKWTCGRMVKWQLGGP